MSSDASPLRQQREKHRGFYIVATSVSAVSGVEGYLCNCVIFRPSANAASFNCQVAQALNTPEEALRRGVDRAKAEIDLRLDSE